MLQKTPYDDKVPSYLVLFLNQNYDGSVATESYLNLYRNVHDYDREEEYEDLHIRVVGYAEVDVGAGTCEDVGVHESGSRKMTDTIAHTVNETANGNEVEVARSTDGCKDETLGENEKLKLDVHEDEGENVGEHAGENHVLVHGERRSVVHNSKFAVGSSGVAVVAVREDNRIHSAE
jgi:hypothetical protein